MSCMPWPVAGGGEAVGGAVGVCAGAAGRQAGAAASSRAAMKSKARGGGLRFTGYAAQRVFAPISRLPHPLPSPEPEEGSEEGCLYADEGRLIRQRVTFAHTSARRPLLRRLCQEYIQNRRSAVRR